MSIRPMGLSPSSAAGAFATLPARLISTGTIVVPAGVTAMRVRLQGGGGGGGGGGTALTSGGVTTQVGGSGGAAGACVDTVIGVVPGETLTVNIGQGGTPGAGGAVNGGAGGNAGAGTDTTITRNGVILVTALAGGGGRGGRSNSTTTTEAGAFGGQGISTTFPQPTGFGGHATTSSGLFPGAPTAGGACGGSGGAPASAVAGGNGGVAASATPGAIVGAASGVTATVNGGVGASALYPACGGGGGGAGSLGGAGGAGGTGGSGVAELYLTGTSVGYVATNNSPATRRGFRSTLQSPGLARSWQVDLFGQDRFEVRPGDSLAGEAAQMKERCEWQHNVNQAFGSDVWFSGSLLVEPGAQVPAPDASTGVVGYWCVLMQFHQAEDAGDAPGASPAFEFLMAPNDTYKINTRGVAEDPLTALTVQSVPTTLQYSGAFTRNTWDNWVFRIKFSKGTASGELDAWRNGVQIASVTGAVIGYNDVLGPYLKYGIYRHSSPITTAVKWANVEVSTSSLLARVAAPLPTFST